VLPVLPCILRTFCGQVKCPSYRHICKKVMWVLPLGLVIELNVRIQQNVV
jgi:hypothetical protein